MATKRATNSQMEPLEEKRRKGAEFILKNLVAEETELVVGPGMSTLGDLRSHVSRHHSVPERLQRMVVGGRTYDYHYTNDFPILRMLPSEPHEYKPIVWLMRARDDDLVAVYTGGIFLESDRATKEALARRRNRPFETITVRAYRTMFNRFRGLHPEMSDTTPTVPGSMDPNMPRQGQ